MRIRWFGVVVGLGLMVLGRAYAQSNPSAQSTENPEQAADTLDDWEPWKGGQGLEFTLGQRVSWLAMSDMNRLHKAFEISEIEATVPLLSAGLAGEVGQGWRMRFDGLLSYGAEHFSGSIRAQQQVWGLSLAVQKRLNREGKGLVDVYGGLSLEYVEHSMRYRRFTAVRPPSLEEMWGVSEPDALTHRTRYVGISPHVSVALRGFPLTLTVGYAQLWAAQGPRLEWGDRINITEENPQGEPEFVSNAPVGPARQLGMFYVSLHFRLHVSD